MYIPSLNEFVACYLLLMCHASLISSLCRVSPPEPMSVVVTLNRLPHYTRLVNCNYNYINVRLGADAFQRHYIYFKSPVL